ncbi:hypothetical protein EJB05_54230, partial [Eragrostis curvula]
MSLVPPRSSASDGDNNNNLEITLDIDDDKKDKRSSSSSMVLRNASPLIKQQFSQDLASVHPCGDARPRLDRSSAATARALKGLQFISRANDRAGWKGVESRFKSLAVNDLLPRSEFGECVGIKETKFAGELFDALARRHNISGDSITKAEVHEFWDQISDTSFDSRLQTFFDMVDKNADGRITEDEVKEIITLSASANKLSRMEEQAEKYARLIMEELDPDKLGHIEIYKLATLLQGPSEPAVRSKKRSSTEEPNPLRRWYRCAAYFLGKTWQRCWVMLLWLSICAGLFAWKFEQYRRRRAVFDVMGYCVCVAKGGAETLKFNMALILLPVCRNTITWLRNHTAVRRAVPLHDNLNFHMVVAAGIAVGAGLHIISHLTCDFPRLLHATDAAYAPLERYFGMPRPPNYWWFVKGTEGWTGFTMLVLMAVAFTLAMPWFRRGTIKKRLPGFNTFWYSHHLFVVVYVLLIVHGQSLYLTDKFAKKSTWMYLAVPVVLYACERLTRALRSRVRPAKIRKVAVYPNKLLTLQFSKPEGFRYKSGQYIFINCASVSPFEWHPFSITSAPQDSYLSVHIRSLGDWTGDLNKLFSEVCRRQPTQGNTGLLQVEYDQEGGGPTADQGLPKVRIDGPYGAPAQDYQQYDVVLLVGLGIGATPMISIIKDIINNMKPLDGDLETGTGRDNPEPTSFQTQRAYFYWMTPEQGSFDWFKDVMDDVAKTDTEGVIEFHNYCTSVYEEGDARSAVITMLQSLNRAKHGGVDVVSGTKVNAHFARPNWPDVYQRIADNHPQQRVGVFYCGSPKVTKELRELAQEFSTKTSTKFEFHKENF